MFKKILVPVDGSEISVKAVEMANVLAVESSAELILLHVRMDEVVPFLGEGSLLSSDELDNIDSAVAKESSAVLERFSEKLKSSTVSIVSEKGDAPWKKIVEVAAAKGCDLIVMASHGRSGLSHMILGSETERVLLHTKIPVLVIR